MKRENFSRKRQAILEAICGTTVHPTAEWVYQKLKPEYPDLSLGTVYRNLSKFKEDGVIISVGVFNGQEHFDGNTAPHNHFVCSECCDVLDLSEEYVSDGIYDRIAEKYGIKVQSHELVFRGVCRQCLEKETV